MSNKDKLSSSQMQVEVFEANIGKEVKIILLNGSEMTAVILDYDRYSILVRTAEKKTVMLFKHGVSHIEESN